MKEKVAEAMIAYDHGDIQRINHFMKVYSYCEMIGLLENIDRHTLDILEIAALTHDIGIKVCEEKYGHCHGKQQEIEGPVIAEEMLSQLNIPRDIIERVCYLIGHHHTYDCIDGIDYQILVESDFLVNLDEGHKDQTAMINAKKNIFKTKTGRQFLENMFFI